MTYDRAVEGFVAVTDVGWYEHLARRPEPGDANFWRPSTRPVKRMAPGTPFFFKLKAPHNAVAGFGYFVNFTVLPDWLAWESFGEANGVDSLESLRSRLQRIRTGARIEADPGGQIGCCLIAEATFFPRGAWIPAPPSWSPRTQTGATYSLDAGEGLQLWAACLERVGPRPVPPSLASAPRFGPPTMVRPRLGQGIFRVQVLDAYERACAVTHEHSLPVLEAAHIRPFAKGGEHSLPNGLALRTDLHRLFDRGYVTIDEQHRLVVGRRLREHFDNGRSYYALDGHSLHLPADPMLRPSAEALTWHREQVYLG